LKRISSTSQSVSENQSEAIVAGPSDSDTPTNVLSTTPEPPAPEGETRWARPVGTVSLVFTDIVDSTAHWDLLGPAFRHTKEEHDRIVRRRAAEVGGFEANTTGDGFLIVFQSAVAAIDFALSTVPEVSGLMVPRATPQPLRIRIGIHTGSVVDDGGEYVGPSTNLAARVCAAARPGQILVTESTASATGAQTRRLGVFRFKGISQPVPLHQVLHASLPTIDEPTPLAVSVQATRLPYYLTPFLGRKDEVENLAALVAKSAGKCVLLTGPPGIGKTRLAVRVAEEIAPDYGDGVRFLSAGSARSTAELYGLVAQDLQLAGAPEKTDQNRVQDYLSPRQMLLVLDDVDGIDTIGEAIYELLTQCRRLTIMVCSTLRLGLRAAATVEVGSLSTPPVSIAADRVGDYDAVGYLVARARQTSRFDLTPKNAVAVAELCRLLDGLPLGLELAAPWLALMSPLELAGSLRSTMDLLSSDFSDLPPRQRTLRASIDWVYGRLAQEDRRLFEDLSIFAGGFTLPTVQAIHGAGATLALRSLHDKSLLISETGPGGTRYRISSLMRMFAAERLAERGDIDRVRDRHAAYYSELAIRNGSAVRSAGEAALNREMRDEIENIAAAFDVISAESTDQGLRVALSLIRYYRRTGLLESASMYVDETKRLKGGDSGLEIELENESVSILLDRHRFHEAAARAHARENAGGLGSPFAHALNLAGLAEKHLGKPASADAHFVRARVAFEASGDRFGMAMVDCNAGLVAYERGVDGFAEAERLWRRALSIQHDVDDRRGIAESTTNLGNLAEARGDLPNAWALYGEALQHELALGNVIGIARSAYNLGGVARLTERFVEAVPLFAVSWQLFDRAGSPYVDVALRSFQEVADALGLSQGERQAIWAPVRDTPTSDIGPMISTVA